MLLAIDPGLVGTGWATFIGDEGHPAGCGVIAAKRTMEWDDKLGFYCLWLRRFVKLNKPDEIVMEWPTYMQSAGGQLSARSGALVKLCMLVGALHVNSGPRCPVILVTPNVWKGQLSKKICIKRIRRILGDDTINELNPTEHAWDAIGIGLYYYGRF